MEAWLIDIMERDAALLRLCGADELAGLLEHYVTSGRDLLRENEGPPLTVSREGDYSEVPPHLAALVLHPVSRDAHTDPPSER